MEKLPVIDIHHQMQAVYGDKCVDVSTVDFGYGSFGKTWGEATGFGRKKITVFLRTEFRYLLKVGKSVLKLE